MMEPIIQIASEREKAIVMDEKIKRLAERLGVPGKKEAGYGEWCLRTSDKTCYNILDLVNGVLDKLEKATGGRIISPEEEQLMRDHRKADDELMYNSLLQYMRDRK
jgi:hypothetical protein